MGENFILQIPHAVILEPNNHLEMINAQMAPYIAHVGSEPWKFEVIYSAATSKETGLTRVEGKVLTDDGKIDINDITLALRLPTAIYKGEVTHPRYIPLHTVTECVAKVIGWSSDRGILENGRWDSQGTKLYEEDGEAATGVGKNKERLIVDGIGDAMVVLVNVLELIGMNAAEMAYAYGIVSKMQSLVDNPHYLFHKMRKYLTEVLDIVYENEAIDSPKKIAPGTLTDDEQQRILGYVQLAMQHAVLLARVYGFTLDQCFSLAWDEIKDRKGFLNADGIFIKESDA